MRRLVESTFVTLDGVVSSPEVWGPPYWDDEHAAYAHKLLFASDALLLGRVTYEGFAVAWPERTGDYADQLNSMPKYVVSAKPTRPVPTPSGWDVTVLGPDVLDAGAPRPEAAGRDVATRIAELKGQPGGNILKFGTGQLDRLLLRHRLVDEYHLWVFPVLAGGGLRLFDGVALTHLDLVDRAQFTSGITVHVLTPKKST